MGLPTGRKSFKIGLAILTCDGQTPSQPRRRSKYALCIIICVAQEKLAVFDGNRRLSRKRCEIAYGYYGTLIGSHGCQIEWYLFWWPWTWVTPIASVREYAFYVFFFQISKNMTFYVFFVNDVSKSRKNSSKSLVLNPSKWVRILRQTPSHIDL